ncbi:MAG: hypothetical protein RL077_5437 [Verrucomicrobiota bacterium]|jgi:hypothetical protein
MSLNESIVEDAALEWFGEQCCVAPSLIPAFSHGEKEECEAIRRLNPAIPSRTLATLRDTLLPKLLSGELSVAGIESRLEAVT